MHPPTEVRRLMCAAALLLTRPTFAQTAPAAPPAGPVQPPPQARLLDGYTLHYQATAIEQGHPRFHAPYSGFNSQDPGPVRAVSATSTLFLGVRLRPGTELFWNPEMAAGRGVGGAIGIAGFPNGETYRIGDPQPVVSTSRLFLRQVFGLDGETEKVEDGPNQIAGIAASRRVTMVAGKFSLPDYFDNNAYSHDPRSQFMNWSLMSQGAWDFPADTRGYTWGLMTEYREPAWAVRGAAVAEPKEANMLQMDQRLGRAHGFVAEGERGNDFRGRKGAARLAAFFQEARMGNYDQAIAEARLTGTVPDIKTTEDYGRSNWGFSMSVDQELADDLGGFCRLGWSSGQNEAWAFTEIDRSQSLGLEWRPARWGRSQDRWGVAAVANELSGPHRTYLADGGHGFIIGDGGLHYGPELIAETYYRFAFSKNLSFSPDYQLVVNPAYNRARGPVNVWGLRIHAEL